jgi:hypothetical protein
MYAATNTCEAEHASGEAYSLPLPELVSDDEYDDSCDATLPTSPKASTQPDDAHIHNILCYPECGHVFKCAFVDNAVNEKQQIHGCRAGCNCESSIGLTQLRGRNKGIGGMF